MKRFTIGSVIVLAIFALSFVAYRDFHKPSYAPAFYEGMYRGLGYADGAIDYNFKIRADENGQILVKNVLNSRKAVREQAASKNGPGGIYWTNIGPNLVGGRTRALLQDNQSNNIWYAGSVTGGIFVTYDAGGQWYEYNSDISSLAISTFAQSPNGTLFAGTGSNFEGGARYGASFSDISINSGTLGDGIFRRVVDANNNHTWERIVGPDPSNQGPPSVEWRYVNRIQASPVDDNRLYVGMNRGLKISNTAQASTVSFFDPPGLGIGNVQDIVVSSDGSRFYAASAGFVVRYEDNGGTDIKELGRTLLSGGTGSASRIALGIAPSNDSVLYAVIANTKDGGCLYGVFQSKDAGVNWTLIGPGGGTFAPLANVGLNCQGDYDLAICVDPEDEGHVVIGGTQIWDWRESPTTPGSGGWTKIAINYGQGRFDTREVHPDIHRIRMPSSKVIWVASDGGINITADGAQTWSYNNNGYITLQCYDIDAAIGIEYQYQGVSYVLQQVMGGAQDNGTNLIGWNPIRPYDTQEISGGDGIDCNFSNLSQQAFTTQPSGTVMRVSFLNPQAQVLWSSELAKLCGGGPLSGCAPFHTRIEYYEKAYADETLDSIKVYVNHTVSIGETLTYFSSIGLGTLPMNFPSYRNLQSGDSIMMPDFAQSRLVMATNNGIYMTRDAAKLGQNTFKWYLIAGAQSYPDAFGTSAEIMDMKWSADGNQLYCVSEGGKVYRIDNLAQGNDSLSLDIRSGQSVVTCTSIGTSNQNVASGGRACRMAVDPNDAGNIVLTFGGYSSSDKYHVFFGQGCDTATNSVSWQPMQGDLPEMPVYSAVIADHDYKTVMIGTEFGAYMTENAFASNANWQFCGNGMPRVPIYEMRQQTVQYPFGVPVDSLENKHYRKIYLGTYGRGFYVSDGLTGIEDKKGEIAAMDESSFQLRVYPNPIRETAIVELNMKESDNVVVEVYDLSGKLVSTIQNGGLNRGLQKLRLDASNLQNGAYLVSARSNKERKVAKVLIVK